LDNFEERLALFFQQRNRLIDALEVGTLDKTSFLEAQYESVFSSGLKPGNGAIRSIREGLFNYQYFNTLAKWERVQSRLYEFRDETRSRDHRRQMDRYYDRKDRETRKLVEFCGADRLEAFYIQLPTKRLEGILLEIILLDEPRAILHTADEGIRNFLEREGIVRTGIFPSVIDSYVKENYG